MNNYEIRVIPKKDIDGNTYWTAYFPKIESVVGGGDTPDEAIKEAQENLEFYLEYLQDEKRQLPQEYVENTFSGNIALRVSKSTHKKLNEIAEQEGISVNSLICNSIENYIGIKSFDYKIYDKIEEIKSISDDTNKTAKLNLMSNLKLNEVVWNSKLTLKD